MNSITKEQSSILHFVESNNLAIHDSVNSCYGITEWFQEYIKSQAFAQLPADHKGKAFSTYTMLFHTLEQLDIALT